MGCGQYEHSPTSINLIAVVCILEPFVQISSYLLLVVSYVIKLAGLLPCPIVHNPLLIKFLSQVKMQITGHVPPTVFVESDRSCMTEIPRIEVKMPSISTFRMKYWQNRYFWSSGHMITARMLPSRWAFCFMQLYADFLGIVPRLLNPFRNCQKRGDVCIMCLLCQQSMNPLEYLNIHLIGTSSFCTVSGCSKTCLVVWIQKIHLETLCIGIVIGHQASNSSINLTNNFVSSSII
ncbi:hypothetical protein ACHAW6_016006 [Cyclotella cf. meneghiniana]